MKNYWRTISCTIQIKGWIITRTVSVSKARQDIFNIIEQTIVNSEPIQITSKKGDVVMLSLEDWSAIEETLYLLQIPGMRESIILKPDYTFLWLDKC